MIYPTQDFVESLDDYIDEYNDENFWEDLAHNLAGRDFIEHFGKEAISGMEMAEQFERRLIEKYEDEFYENGIQNLRIVSNLEQG